MGMGVLLLTAAMLAAGCGSPQQREQKKQMEQEKKIADAEAKKQKEVAAAEAKRQKEEAAAEAKRQKEQAAIDAQREKEEATRMAEADKKQRAEETKTATAAKAESDQYEKDSKDEIGHDIMRDERHVRTVDRFVLAQSAQGAREDATLSDQHFDGAELNAGRQVGLFAGQVLEAFNSQGHGGQHRSPLFDLCGIVKLGLFNLAGAALPRSMKFFDTPALAITEDHAAGVFERAALDAGQQHPVQRLLAARCGSKLPAPDHVHRQRPSTTRRPVPQVERYGRDPHRHPGDALGPPGACWHVQVVGADNALLLNDITQVARSIGGVYPSVPAGPDGEIVS